MQRFADMQMFRDGTFPSSAGHVATTTLLDDMQTFVLLDVLEDLRPPANLRYQAWSLLAQYGQKRNWNPLFCPRE